MNDNLKLTKDQLDYILNKLTKHYKKDAKKIGLALKRIDLGSWDAEDPGAFLFWDSIPVDFLVNRAIKSK